MDAWSSSASLFNSRASPFCAVRSLVPPWVFAPFLPRECPRCALSSAFSVASRRFSRASSDGERPDPVRSLASAATASSRSAISRSSSRLASILEASGMGASAAREFDADDGAEVVRSDSDSPAPSPSDGPSCSTPFSSTHVSLLSIFSIRFILASDDEGDAGAFPGLSLLGLRSGFAASVFKSRTLLRTVLNEVAISNSNVGSPAGECVGDREDA